MNFPTFMQVSVQNVSLGI